MIVDDAGSRPAAPRPRRSVPEERGAARVVVAVPVAAHESAEPLRDVADQVICVREPERLGAIGAWYADFDQISDAEVVELLNRA